MFLCSSVLKYIKHPQNIASANDDVIPGPDQGSSSSQAGCHIYSDIRTKEITFCSYSTKRVENSAPQVQALKNWNKHQIHLNGY